MQESLLGFSGLVALVGLSLESFTGALALPAPAGFGSMSGLSADAAIEAPTQSASVMGSVVGAVLHIIGHGICFESSQESLLAEVLLFFVGLSKPSLRI